MRKMYFSIISMCLFIFVVWLFMLAMANDFDLHDVRINMFATVKRFEQLSSDDWVSYTNQVASFFGNVNFNFEFQYVDVNSISSFFQNIGIWFNGVWNLIKEFFLLLANCIKTLGLGIAYIARLVINVFTFVFNPVQL